jgi:uncharacterized membrane protein YdbT with pleckstrin-like domain
MNEIVIRPSMKRARLGFALAGLILLGVIYLYVRYREHLAWWVLLVGLLPFFAPVAGWLDSKRLKLTLNGQSVRGEAGLMAKEVREIPLSRVTGVSVERSFAQRLYGVGTVIIEGAGPGERIVSGEVDAPKKLARRISEAAKLAGAAAAVRGLTEKESEDDE